MTEQIHNSFVCCVNQPLMLRAVFLVAGAILGEKNHPAITDDLTVTKQCTQPRNTIIFYMFSFVCVKDNRKDSKDQKSQL